MLLAEGKQIFPEADSELESTFVVHILTVSDQIVICTTSIHSSYLFRHCLHHTGTIYGWYQKKVHSHGTAHENKTH